MTQNNLAAALLKDFSAHAVGVGLVGLYDAVPFEEMPNNSLVRIVSRWDDEARVAFEGRGRLYNALQISVEYAGAVTPSLVLVAIGCLGQLAYNSVVF